MLFYRILLWLALPVLLVRFGFLWATGSETGSDIAERFGHTPPAPPRGPVLWLHAASNGELASAGRLIKALLDRNPTLELVVTTNSVTGRELARDAGHERLTAVLAPLDLRPALARFLARWNPRALVTIEGELWPNRFELCRMRRVPVIVAGARMSERAARGWARRPVLALRLMDAVRYLSAQDDVSERRFRALGLTDERIGPVVSLKAIAALGQSGMPAEERLPFPRTLTLLAASTHEGEEDLVLEAFVAARRERPGLRLIIAPRHPRRRPEIEAAVAARRLSLRVRSRGEEPDAGCPVYLADTMGEMPRWYAAAGMTFVGGSLVDRGGHTPFEPAAFGSAILHGPHVANFADAYRALDEAHGAVRTDTPAALGRRVVALADPARQAAMARAATQALSDFAARDGFDDILAAIETAAGLSPAHVARVRR